MASPPAWSMGASKRNGFHGNAAPGPGAYEAHTRLKHASPSWKLGTASRGNDRRSDVPGPGSYDSPGKVSTSAPKHIFGVKSPQKYESFAPGPGAYDPATQKGYDRNAPSYTFGSKTGVANDKTRVPGPGSYEQTSKIQNIASPGYRIGSAKRDGLYKDSTTPGPGSYGTRPTSAFNKESGPKYGFGTANRDELAGMSRTLPGPGAYEHKGMFESPVKGGGASIVPRRPDSAIFSAGRTPGPGAYTVNTNLKTTTSPAYRMGSASRDTKERAGAPGPGNYDPRAVQGKGGVRIGTSVRSPLNRNSGTPGPGSYEYKLKVGEGPKYVMNPRREEGGAVNTSNSRYVPGPGSYNPEVHMTRDKAPGVKMGSSNRADLYEGRANPGPGQYDVRGRLNGPKWGFGSENRGQGYKSDTPGPGSYDHKPKIGDVAPYAYGGAPLKIAL